MEIVELRTPLQPDCLVEDDVDGLDVLGHPGLTQGDVGADQAGEVVDGRLEKEVIDAEDVVLVGDGQQESVKLVGLLGGFAVGLLHGEDQVGRQVEIGESLDRLTRHRRGEREVEDGPLPRLVEYATQVIGLGDVGGEELGVLRQVPGTCLCDQGGVVHLFSADADDAHRVGVLPDAGDEQAAGQVSGAAENDDGLRFHVSSLMYPGAACNRTSRVVT